MPRNSRYAMLGAAKTIRFQGETVTLLTPATAPDSSDATPFSATDYQAPPDLSTYKKTVVYAKVTYLPSETVTYDEGGRETNRRVKIEVPIDLEAQMHSAFAVQLQDGTVLRKVQEQISEGRDMFIVECQGEMKVAQ